MAKAILELEMPESCRKCPCSPLKLLDEDALEKQKPKKPHEYYNWGDLTVEEQLEANQWYCKCGGELDEAWNYCAWCGQKIDWD